MATETTIRERSGQRGKSFEDVVGYAVSHRTRVELLIILNQGTYCATELSEIIGEPINNVSGHLKELADGGAIEIAEAKKRRNFTQYFYRAIAVPIQTKEEFEKMHPIQRQIHVGLIIQSLIAELMAALWASKICNDPDHTLLWDRLNVDSQGRREITEEQARHFERLAEIEEESLLRAARVGESTVPYIVGSLGFERGRKAPVAPGSASAECQASSD